MAVDQHPSRRPSPPRKPPATSTTAGTINKIPHGSGSGQEGVSYGFHHELSVHPSHKSEMAHHFAAHAGKEHPQEGTTSRAKYPGDENKQDEPD